MKIDVNTKLKNQKGEDIYLNSIPEDKILIFVYPKDNSPGCSVQAKKYSDKLEEFKKIGVKIFGISNDSLKSHEKFTQTCNLKIDLLCLDENSILKDLNVIRNISVIITNLTILERSTFLIDKKTGGVLKEWRKVNPFQDTQVVLDYLKNN